MSKKSRIEDLESIHEKNSDVITGVQWFGPTQIMVDGTMYASLEEIPQELHLKYPNMGKRSPEQEERRYQDLADARAAFNKFPDLKTTYPEQWVQMQEDEKKHQSYVKQNQS